MIKIKKIIFLALIPLLICIEKGNAEIKDSLFMTIGNKAIVQSDIVNEIKILLILNNESYSDDIRDKLQKSAVKSIINRKVKEIEIDRNNFFEFNKKDFNDELLRLATNINIDVDTLKNICASNDLDFSLIENNIKIDLMWNSLIFQLYKNKLSINTAEINEQLKLRQNVKEINEYLISEIVIESVEKNKEESKINELKKRIKIEGFENVAKDISISKTALSGGNLGWLSENVISEEIKSTIINTPVGELSEPIFLSQGVLFFKIRDKRIIESELSLEERKDQLVNSEKIKILKMHSLSHYDKSRRSITIKFLQ